MGLCAAFVLSLVGCVEQFDPPSLVNKTRVLGARAEIMGDDGRAWPRLADGVVYTEQEQVTISWHVGFSGDQTPLSWALQACPAIQLNDGVAICIDDSLPIFDADEAIVKAIQTAPVMAMPSMTYTMPLPDLSALAGAGGMPSGGGGEAPSFSLVLLVKGVVCADGEPVAEGDVDTWRCPATPNEGAVQFYAPIEIPALHPNQTFNNAHPDASDLEAKFEGAAWVAGELPVSDCQADAEAMGLPIVKADEESEFTFDVSASALESYSFPDDEAGAEPRVEQLLVSQYVSAGEVERLYSLFKEDDLMSDTKWSSPTLDSNISERVRFNFVITDRRGGFAWFVRDVCVVPAS